MTPEIRDHHGILKVILESDPYNVYCIDCKFCKSDHASLTFGVFLCKDCALGHISQLGMDYSYIKSLYNEEWDVY